jgi:MFS family permease
MSDTTAASVTATDRRPVTAVLVANAVSLTGDALAAVAIPWFVLETTGSAARAGLSGGVAVLPAFLAGIFGGTVVDRLGPKRASVVADVVSGVAILMIPLLYATVGLAFWHLLVLVLLGGALDVPGITARRAMLPELTRLSGMRLERVNSLLEGNQQLAFLLGPPLAGVAIGLVGAERVLWADAASFALSAGVVARLVPGHLYPRRAREPGVSYRDELRAGLSFLWNDRLLRAASLSLSVSNATGGAFFSVIYIVYAGSDSTVRPTSGFSSRRSAWAHWSARSRTAPEVTGCPADGSGQPPT